ncbi:glycosyltransferase [Nocardioides guangzhouensis]|uniref:glycosyltransferase n=1 Tax=Nocardioides guangzhouensis TaxID=2497878 RepID=UPI0014382626|nr:glycosyltransferase [Nocardioides guangzhouensis]
MPRLGGWEPSLSVSVVVPAHQPRHLALVLAGLAAQSYPTELLEVVVVDDGSVPPIELPEIRPARTRVVRPREGWGPAVARQVGAEASDGAVLHWLDADMVPHRHQVEAQLRWHHAVDYAVVLGHKVFVDGDAFSGVEPVVLRDTVLAGSAPEDLARGGVVLPHTWIEAIMEATDSLAAAGPRAMRVHVGASGSVGRDLFRESGGFPTDLITGEDIVLGYRLREVGGVFIPDAEARSVHVGASAVMRVEADVNRYNKPFITDLVPEFRGYRSAVPRTYAVPYLEVVLDVTDVAYETARLAADAVLASTVPDLVVALVGPWDELSDERRSVLDEALLDLRLLRAAYTSDSRVALVDNPSERSRASFRLSLPGLDEVPSGRSLETLLFTMDDEHLGLVVVDLSKGGRARLERTGAVARARRLVDAQPDPADLEAALEAVYPTRSYDAATAGFVPLAEARQPKRVRGLKPWRTKA